MTAAAYALLVFSFGLFYAGMFWWQASAMRSRRVVLAGPVALGLALGSSFGWALSLLIQSQGGDIPQVLTMLFVVTGALGFALESSVWAIGVRRFFRKVPLQGAADRAQDRVVRTL
jgi:hypothetical protein